MNAALVNLLVAVDRCAEDLDKDPSQARATLAMMIEDGYEAEELPPWYMAFVGLAEALIDHQVAT